MPIVPEDLLRPTPAGLYCPPGDFYVDPTRTVERAVITHGHADHARAGHNKVIATEETLAIMASRYGKDFARTQSSTPYGDTTKINGVSLKLVPAGHILGSAQAVIEMSSTRIVVSGDYKRRADLTCAPFEPVPCDVFVTEATFGLPVFVHPDDALEIGKLLASVKTFPHRTHLVGAYTLGKAQRVITLIRKAGFDAPLYLHGAAEKLCKLYQDFDIDLGELRPVKGEAEDALQGQIVIAPPSSLNDRWSRRLGDAVTAFASGWMRVRARARQRGVELPLIISDHADWEELTSTITEIQPGELWVTHGQEDALVHFATTQGISAKPLSLVGYDEDGGDTELEAL